MNKSLNLSIKISRFFFLLISICLFIYLINVLINGERGIISYNKIKKQHLLSKNEFILLKEINDKLENKIMRLSPNTLDLDYFDEQLRLKTGKLLNNEIFINLDSQ